jgi:hypothetical protein
VPFAGWLYTDGRWQLVFRSPDRERCRRRLLAWAGALRIPPALAAVNAGGGPPPRPMLAPRLEEAPRPPRRRPARRPPGRSR